MVLDCKMSEPKKIFSTDINFVYLELLTKIFSKIWMVDPTVKIF